MNKHFIPYRTLAAIVIAVTLAACCRPTSPDATLKAANDQLTSQNAELRQQNAGLQNRNNELQIENGSLKSQKGYLVMTTGLASFLSIVLFCVGLAAGMGRRRQATKHEPGTTGYST